VKTLKQIIIVIISVLAGIVLAFVFNFLILEKILIPDPCYYHTHDANKVFDLFYELTSAEGYHPFPTKFNFIFTAIIGAVFGLMFSLYKIIKRNQRETTKAKHL
jgi:ABC-type antimicrobial peptide transport system permease subunit